MRDRKDHEATCSLQIPRQARPSKKEATPEEPDTTLRERGRIAGLQAQAAGVSAPYAPRLLQRPYLLLRIGARGEAAACARKRNSDQPRRRSKRGEDDEIDRPVANGREKLIRGVHRADQRQRNARRPGQVIVVNRSTQIAGWLRSFGIACFPKPSQQFGRRRFSKLLETVLRGGLSAEGNQQGIAVLPRHRCSMSNGQHQLPDQRQEADQGSDEAQTGAHFHADSLPAWISR